MGFKGLKPILYGGREVWPLVEGGKGVAATNHASSGAWAAAGGIGTVSAVNADSYDAEGKIVPQIYQALTRQARHDELIRFAIDGAVEQVRRAYDISNGKGAININVLWEMGGAQLLHPENPAGHRPRRRHRAEPDVRRPCRLQVQDRSVLFQQLHPQREADG